jgi:hypothetical protein
MTATRRSAFCADARTVAAAGGQVSLVAGDEMNVEGVDSPTYEVVALSEGDEFDDWVDGTRASRGAIPLLPARQPRHPGGEDLDDYGRWSTIPSYGAV